MPELLENFIVIKRLLNRHSAAALALLAWLSPALQAAAPTELFLSEYIEGSSFTKAIEIYNGTGACSARPTTRPARPMRRLCHH